MHSQNTHTEKSVLSHLLFLLLGPCLFLLILAPGRPETMTPEAHKVGAIAAWMAVWWLTDIIPLGATALIPFALFPLLGVMPGDQTLFSFAEDIIFLMMGGFMLAAAMERWNLHRRIALSVIDSLGATPRRIVLGFMLATGFVSMWISNTSTTLMMLPIATAVLVKLGEMEEDVSLHKLAPALMLAIAYSASIGGVATLIGTPPNMYFKSQAQAIIGQEYSFFEWLKIGIPFTVILLPLTWLVLVRFLFALPDQISQVSHDVIRNERLKLGRMNRGEIIVAVVFTLTALGWIFRKTIPLGSFVIPGLETIFPLLNKDATIAVCAALVLFAIPVDLSKKVFVLDMKTALKIPWDILLLFSGGICLANGFEQSQLSSWLATQLAFFQHFHPYLVLLICVTMIVFLTEITSNAATAIIFIPIMAALSESIGQHPFFLMIPCTLGVSMAFMLPVATPPNAIVYGSGFVSIQQMSRTGLVINIISIVCNTLLSIALLSLVLGIDIH